MTQVSNLRMNKTKVFSNTYGTIVALLSLILVCLPTSNNIISENTSLVNRYFFAIAILLAVVIIKFKSIFLGTFICSVIFVSLLLLFTFISVAYTPNFQKDIGSMLKYGVFILLINCDFSKIKSNKIIDNMFLLFCVILLLLGVGVIIGREEVRVFVATHYQMYWNNAVWWKVSEGKPIAFFANHSIASFFYYLNFITLYYRNTIEKSKINILLMLGMIFLIINTKCMTAVCLLLSIGLFYIYNFIKGKSSLKNYFYYILVLVIIIISISAYNKDITKFVNNIFVLDLNGFNGRYSSDGALQIDIKYLLNNILPTGLTIANSSNGHKLLYTDCGYIVIMLRGGILAVISFYLGFYKFLFRNVKESIMAKFFLFSILIFEIGYPILVELRMLCYLPFLMIYFNYLYNLKNTKKIRECNKYNTQFN